MRLLFVNINTKTLYRDLKMTKNFIKRYDIKHLLKKRYKARNFIF